MSIPVDVRREHNHIPEPTKLTALEALQEMLARATTSNENVIWMPTMREQFEWWEQRISPSL